MLLLLLPYLASQIRNSWLSLTGWERPCNEANLYTARGRGKNKSRSREILYRDTTVFLGNRSSAYHNIRYEASLETALHLGP